MSIRLIAAAALALASMPANARVIELQIVQGVPASVGITDAAPYQTRKEGTIWYRHGAGAVEIEEAPGNACGRPAFEVMSGANRGACVGR